MGSRSGTKKHAYVYVGGVEKITYEDEVNGITVIRTRYRFKKQKKKKLR